MTVCLPDPFIFVYSFRQYVMIVAVWTRGNLEEMTENTKRRLRNNRRVIS